MPRNELIIFIAGPILPSIFNISSMQQIALGYNNLFGHLSSNMFDYLPRLNYLDLSGIQFSGKLNDLSYFNNVLKILWRNCAFRNHKLYFPMHFSITNTFLDSKTKFLAFNSRKNY